MAFLVVVALATAMTVPVVGALLIFSLMIGRRAAARSFTDRPLVAMLLSVAIALATVWSAIAISFASNWPIGFFVGALSAFSYGVGRGWAQWRRTRVAGPRPSDDAPRSSAPDPQILGLLGLRTAHRARTPPSGTCGKGEPRPGRLAGVAPPRT